MITIGCDPELFLTKNGKFHSAYGLIPGTKKNPFKVNEGAIQVDGMALEFNIDPAASREQFLIRINRVMAELRRRIPSDFNMTIVPVAHFEATHMAEQPGEAIELGCDPDFNAYTGDPNPRPDGNGLARTAAGHIHIGWTADKNVNDEQHFNNCRALVQELDATLGLYSLNHDQDNERRELYGQPGAFRPKSYGLEYRVPSNFWLRDEQFTNWMYSWSLSVTGNWLNMKKGDKGYRKWFMDSYGMTPEVAMLENNRSLAHTWVNTFSRR